MASAALPSTKGASQYAPQHATHKAAALLIGSAEGPAAARPLGFGRGVPAQERVNFTAQMAMMTGAGVSVSAALKSVIKQCQRDSLRQTLDEVLDDVTSGSSFSSALRKHPQMFDGAYVATVSAGEASGKMQSVLAQLAELQRDELRLNRTIRGMLVYPVLLMGVSLSVITTLVVFVLPRFASIFEQYEIALPAITQALMATAEELRARWWLWGPLAAGALGGAAFARATEGGRDAIDTALVRTPGVRRVVRTLLAARSCRMLGLLIASGVPLLECLHLLRQAISNRPFRRLTEDLEDAVTNGRSLSDALENNEVLPPSATELIATAEKTGRLGEVCSMMGAHYEEEGQALARQLVSAIEPLVTIVMGAVVAVVVLAVMLPVFDIATIAQR